MARVPKTIKEFEILASDETVEDRVVREAFARIVGQSDLDSPVTHRAHDIVVERRRHLASLIETYPRI